MIAKHDVRVPAARWHEWQPKLKPDEWLLLCAILRRTYGWDKMMDIVSTSQLVAMTGMTERRVQRNMASLLKFGAPVKVLSQESRLSYTTQLLDRQKPAVMNGRFPDVTGVGRAIRQCT